MNKIKLKSARWLAAIILGLPTLGLGQSVVCTQRLNEANTLYDAGRLPEVLEKLNEGDCMQEGFSKEQKTRAYRLMALVYIFLDDEPNAEDAVIKLLTSDPEHPYSVENDPAEFIVLYKKFRYKPIFRTGVIFGVNQSSANSLAEYGTFSYLPDIYDRNSYVSKSYSPGIGMHVGALIEYTPIKEIQVLKDFELVLRIMLSWQNYDVSYPVVTTMADTIGGAFRIEKLKESQNWISAPLGIRYNIPLGNIIPYVTGGASAQYLLSSKRTGDRVGTTSVSADEDLIGLEMRNQFNWSYFGGAGVKFMIERTKSFFIEGTYHIGGQNFVNGENRYASQNLDFNIAHIDDDKSLNSLQISAGFIWSIYKPKKYDEQKLMRDATREIKREQKIKK